MVSGGSYGGHMTLAVSYLYSDQIACSVDIVGMSNLVTFLENTEGYRRDLRRVEYGDERDPEMRAFLERIAPINHADEDPESRSSSFKAKTTRASPPAKPCKCARPCAKTPSPSGS